MAKCQAAAEAGLTLEPTRRERAAFYQIAAACGLVDLCIGKSGHSPTELLEAAKLFNDRWKPEADAVSWMSIKSRFENRFHMLRAVVTMKLGLRIFSQAKSADIPYSEVRRKAQRLWPLWA